jgi:hypothetical protein
MESPRMGSCDAWANIPDYLTALGFIGRIRVNVQFKAAGAFQSTLT